MLISQLIRPAKNLETTTSNTDIFNQITADAEVVSLVKSACYDCHSNTTQYPWYSQIAPASWWIAHHVNEGKEHLNFSEWTGYSPEKAAHKLRECFEEVAKEEMPLKSYTWLHQEAQLTEGERAKLVAWFKKSEKSLKQTK